VSADARIQFAVPQVTEADVVAVTDVLRRGWITTGEQCERLEEELAVYLGAPHVVAVASCTHALEISLASLGLALFGCVTLAERLLIPWHISVRRH